jgi:hypothetical protein
MTTPLDSFGKTAQRLATNPLGIIALFIVLVYGIAGIVFGTSAQYLESNQKTIIVWFLVLFPVLVLGVFAWLVTKHHTKLYAPRDFQDASTFLRTLSLSEQKEKIEKEVEEIISEAPPVQEVDATRREPIRKKIYLIEDLVLRDIEAEFSVSVQRQIAFAGADFGIDGMFAKDGEGYGIEIKYMRRQLGRQAIDQIVHYSRVASDRFGWKRFNFILAIVYEGLSPAEMESEKDRISKILSEASGKFIVRAYDYAGLLSKYGIKENC